MLRREQVLAVAEMGEMLGRPLSIRHQYAIATNGVALALTPAEAETVAALPDVALVVVDGIGQPQTDAGPGWIGAGSLWDGSQTGGLPGTMGEGILVGVIDTGINFSHPSFAATGGDGYTHTNPFGAGVYLGWCAANAGCNDKLVGAWSWPESGDNPEDDWQTGHGSNVAGIAAGNVITAVFTAPTTILTETLSGVAPHANVIAYDICKPGSGCPDSLSLAAIEQAILDGVDVLNYSVKSDGAGPWQNPIALAFLNARAAGIFVAAAAGNDGPGAGTIIHPADSPWITAVGNVTHNGRFQNSLTSMSGGSTTPPVTITGASITGGYGPVTITTAALISPTNGACNRTFPAGTWSSGEIVFCEYSSTRRTTKAANVAAGGGGGVIIHNGVDEYQRMGIDRFVIPGVNIAEADAAVLVDWLAAGNGQTAVISGTVRQYAPQFGDQLYYNSSRGPNAPVNVLKPNVAAPGVKVWSAGKNTGGGVPDYSFYSGTSQSSPHVAGAGALLMALHPGWTPSEIESALMLTAVPTIVEQDGDPADSFAQGSGRVELTAVARAGLVLDETAAHFTAANPADGGDPKTLNLAGLVDGSCAPLCSWTRTFSSTLPMTATWTLTSANSSRLSLSASPETFTIPPGGQQTVTITAHFACTQQSGWNFADLILTEGSGTSPALHLPTAVAGLCDPVYLPLVTKP
jgi:subtilisin family serine protease